jgi:prepilin-type N-terminal cleavage/methylation domain-containing protein
MTVKQKYSILMAATQNSTKGFTLIELIFGLLIMGLVGGFTLNALVEASNSFNQDKKNIQSAQNLTTVLELIGNDVKQAGERINNTNFPAIELRQDSAQGSTVIVRRALVTRALTFCGTSMTGTTAASLTSLVVKDPSLNIPAGTNPGCDQNSSASATPTPLREAINYRCELGDPNHTYDPAQDSCNPTPAPSNTIASLQNVLVALSAANGDICVLRYTGENLAASPATSTLVLQPLTTTNCATAGTYNANIPIYLIEERRYTLDPLGNLNVSTDGGQTYTTLISGIARFKVSARGYRVAPAAGATPEITLEDRVIDENGGGGSFACTAADGVSMPASTPTRVDPTYACRLNFGANTANWKQIAGIRIELQARYDPTGQNPTPTAAQIDKLTAGAEFFPRNVLSK